jgi:hypothetical protein
MVADFMPPAQPGFSVAANEAERIWTAIERLTTCSTHWN